MTIFVKAAKELILRVLKKSNQDSLLADGAYVATLFKTRDVKFSEKQRTITDQLITQIAEFKPLENDKQSLKALMKFIQDTDTVVENKRLKKAWGRGSLNKTLENLNTNLNRLYTRLVEIKDEINLFNIQEANEPFDILCGNAIYYLGEDRICAREPNIFIKSIAKVTTYATGESVIAIRKRKEDCLKENLIKCQKKLNGLNKDGEDYKSLCLQLVEETIDAALRENNTICEELKPLDAIPLQLTVGLVANIKAPALRPSRGRLRVALENAKEEIEEICKKKEPKKLASTF